VCASGAVVSRDGLSAAMGWQMQIILFQQFIHENTSNFNIPDTTIIFLFFFLMQIMQLDRHLCQARDIMLEPPM
jgi:hypothetical protein